MKRLPAIFLLAALLVAACSPPPVTALPTVMDLNAVSTQDAATEAAAGATTTALFMTNRPPTLPPTWTASPAPTEAATVEATTVSTPTPAAGLTGSIYYIFNGDSIASLAADGSHEQLIYVGGAPAELTLSPDGALLAFTAQGGGSAREVFIISLDGSYVQQVSCLGFARVIAPAWSFDSQSLAFAASQTPDGLVGIYAAGVAGSGQCPAGNNQRLLAQTGEEDALTSVAGLSWNRAGDFVFFSSGALFGVSASGGDYRQMTYVTGYGPDLSPAHSPINDTLFYLKGSYDEAMQTYGGQVFQASTSDLSAEMLTEQPGARLFARAIRWSVDGRFLLAASEREIFVQDTVSNTSPRIFTNGNFYPAPAFSPDARHIALIDSGRGTPTIPQIFVLTREGDDKSQISRHQEGTISDLNWAAQ